MRFFTPMAWLWSCGPACSTTTKMLPAHELIVTSTTRSRRKGVNGVDISFLRLCECVRERERPRDGGKEKSQQNREETKHQLVIENNSKKKREEKQRSSTYYRYQHGSETVLTGADGGCSKDPKN